MGIQSLSEEVLLIELPREPQTTGELDLTTRLINSKTSRHVIVDFSAVEIMPSGTIGSLMMLKRAAGSIDHQLVLCSVSAGIQAIFRRVGLQALFQFATDKLAAIEMLDRETPART